MKNKILGIFVNFIIFLAITSNVSAHPGRTDSSGCHTCRTNCPSWGLSYGEYHCHNGGSSGSSNASVSNINESNTIQPIIENNSDSTDAQYIVPPTSTPTEIPTSTPKPTKKPTPTKKIKAPYIETELDKKKFFKVINVVDGDTIKTSIRGNVETIRLLAIDTPETVDPRKPVQCFGKEASNKMKDFVSGKYVKLIDDRSQGNRDKYGRLLRYVYLEDGTFINAEMVKQGYAFSYKQYPTRYLEQFNKYEKEAREKNLGLWNSCK